MIKKYGGPVLICIAVLALCIGVLQWRSMSAGETLIESVETTDMSDNRPSDNEAENALAYDDNGILVIGDKNAPVTILEYSSLSCPHCATFHKNTLASIKTDYVDTGKVKFVFNDFPLNAPAMAGSLLLKCIPIENRYEFMEMLFDQQMQWAMDTNFNTKLKQYAALLGIGSDKAEACMTDETAQAKIIANMREASDAYEITSTPSFIIQPGDEKLIGPQAYGAFSTRIEALLNNKAE